MLLLEGEAEPTAAMQVKQEQNEVPPVVKAGCSTGGSNTLVWYTYSYGQLVSRLQSLGHTVTTSATLPADLSPYDVIWHVGAFNAVTAAEQTRLAAFLAAGGGLHMTGERPCCDTMNGSWTTFVRSVVVGGSSITIGNQGDINSMTGTYWRPYAVNPDATGGLATTPNAVSTLFLNAAGGIVGLSDRENVLAEGRSQWTGAVTAVGAVWDSEDLVGGAGRLTLMMDVNWFASLAEEDDAALVENIQTFLQGGSGARPVADAGADQAAECLAPGSDMPVMLDGTGSSAPGGGVLTYEWSIGGNVIATGATPTVYLAPGEYDITLVVSSGSGCTSEPDTVHISLVADTEPPTLTVLGDNPATVECGSTYSDAGATAEDICSGNLDDSIITTSDVDDGTPGTYTVRYDIADAAGNAATASRTVLVQDTTPPVLTVAPMILLWPPNHTMHTFTLADCVVAIDEACDDTLDVNAQGSIVSIYSDEPENTTGDGNHAPDMVLVGPSTWQVRAERRGNGNGRVYGVTFTVTDASGNATTATCQIGVPHDQSGALPVDDGAASGHTVTP